MLHDESYLNVSFIQRAVSALSHDPLKGASAYAGELCNAVSHLAQVIASAEDNRESVDADAVEAALVSCAQHLMQVATTFRLDIGDILKNAAPGEPTS